MAPTTSIIGRVVPIYQGDWSNTKQYVGLDEIRYNGGDMYRVIIGKTPPIGTLPTNTDYFSPIFQINSSVKAYYDSIVNKGTDFNKKYLGSSASDPTVDGNGTPMGASNIGAMYFNSTENVLKSWSGMTWNYTTINQATIDSMFSQLAAAVRTDSSQSFNSTQKTTARTNLGLGTAALLNTSDIATVAQGAKADTALQASDLTYFRANSFGSLASKSSVIVSDIATNSGTPSAATYLAGDNTWKAVSNADMQSSIYDPTAIRGDAFSRSNHTGTQAIATILNLQATLDAKVLSSNVVGTIVYPTSNAPPPNTVRLNGALLSRASYPRLWAYAQASGNIVAENVKTDANYTTGDGSTTFRVPDYRGLFIRVWDNGKGIDSGRNLLDIQQSANLLHNHTLTDNGHIHTATLDSQGTHNHAITDNGHVHDLGNTFKIGGTASGAGGAWVTGGPPASYFTTSATTGITLAPAGAHIHNATIASAVTGITIAASGGSESRPINVSVLACVYY